MHIQSEVLLKNYTTLRIGGLARFFVEVSSVEELIEALKYATERSLPVLCIGGGSNILVPDSGFNGLVIKIAIRGIKLSSQNDTTVDVVAGAGEVWDEFVSLTTTYTFSGLENLSGIPGTVGAAPVQNIGAYGVECKDTIKWVEVLDVRTHTIKCFDVEQCQFAYRDSIFKKKKGMYIITRVCFSLVKNKTPVIDYDALQVYFGTHTTPTAEEVRRAVLSIRAKKFPPFDGTYGTAGSFFKNPIITRSQYRALESSFPGLPAYYVDIGTVKIPLGYILDSLGWKGKCNENRRVGTFANQALVLVTFPNATYDDVDYFARAIEFDVKEKTNISLEREVVCVPSHT